MKHTEEILMDLHEAVRGELYDQIENIPRPRPRVKNTLNANQFPKDREINTLPSMTIPDLTLSIKDMVLRYTRGLPVTGNPNQPIYEGDANSEMVEEPLPDLKKLDLAEIQELREFAQHKIEKIREESVKIAEARKQKEIAELNEFRKAKAEAQQQKLNQQNSQITEQQSAD